MLLLRQTELELLELLAGDQPQLGVQALEALSRALGETHGVAAPAATASSIS